jgi:hypothetical protein
MATRPFPIRPEPRVVAAASFYIVCKVCGKAPVGRLTHHNEDHL